MMVVWDTSPCQWNLQGRKHNRDDDKLGFLKAGSDDDLNAVCLFIYFFAKVGSQRLLNNQKWTSGWEKVEVCAFEHGLFPLVDVGWWWRSIFARDSAIADFLWQLWGCNFYITEDPWRQLFFFSSCCTLEASLTRYRLSRHTATANRLAC